MRSGIATAIASRRRAGARPSTPRPASATRARRVPPCRRRAHHGRHATGQGARTRLPMMRGATNFRRDHRHAADAASSRGWPLHRDVAASSAGWRPWRWYRDLLPAAVGERSHWHRVDAAEIWHWYAGAPLELSLSTDGVAVDMMVLGNDLASGARPQILVPAGVWQSAASAAPGASSAARSSGVRFSGFEMAAPVGDQDRDY